MMTVKATVLFVCVHNAGRSQMAAVLTNALSGGGAHVRSADIGITPSGLPASSAAQAKEPQ
jgi:arsenate reductase